MPTTEKHTRPSWDEYFMKIAHAVASRSSCDRGRVGCVFARDKQILVTGYAGAPRGMPDCDTIGHQMKTVTHEDGHTSQHCMRTAHAEQNAIVQAARVGVSIEGATCYCKMTPCAACAKMMVNAGIKRVVCEKQYHAAADTEAMFKELGIELVYFTDTTEAYAKQ
ncbi:MAG: cytidine/deoxycytidylate deaminase family protein [Candidatus Magasanikbacteria bacterium]|nr:cytidine/deoxycytidylate deaminase family protein [Candidatus Magasanikbacteria bacterium]